MTTDQTLLGHGAAGEISAEVKSTGSRWLAPLLAFVAGFVDTAGFVVLGGLFLAHVTGNFVVLGAQLQGQGGTDVAEKLGVLPIFVIGVGLAWVLQRRFARQPGLALALLETVLLLGALIAAGAIERSDGGGAALRWVLITCGVLAMGVQAMLGRAEKLPMTTVMTGNVTQTTADALEALWVGKGKAGSLRSGVLLVVAFASGAVCAGLGLRFVGAASLGLPVVAMVAVSVIVSRGGGSVGTRVG